MSEQKDRKKPGPKPRYLNQAPSQDGAPKLISRIDPEVLEHVKAQPEGVRPYLERIIRADMREDEPVATATEQQEPEAQPS